METSVIFVFFLTFVSVDSQRDYHKHLELVGWQPFPVYRNISVYEKTACQRDATNNLDWLRFDNDQRCINIVTNVDVPRCFYDQLLTNNISYINRDMNYIINRKLDLKRIKLRFFCNSFIIFTHKIGLIEKLFTGDRINFYPFTKIYLFVPKQLIIPKKCVSAALQLGVDLFAVRNSIFNEFIPRFNLKYRKIKNLYTNKTLKTSEKDSTELRKYFGTVLTHPLFDNDQTQRNTFRIALFHCPPYVIIDADKKKYITRIY